MLGPSPVSGQLPAHVKPPTEGEVANCLGSQSGRAQYLGLHTSFVDSAKIKAVDIGDTASQAPDNLATREQESEQGSQPHTAPES